MADNTSDVPHSNASGSSFMRRTSACPQVYLSIGGTKYRSGVNALFILTWRRGGRDQEGGSLRKRPRHCTRLRLKLAISPNVGNSGAEFLVAGVRVRAAPYTAEVKKKDVILR